MEECKSEFRSVKRVKLDGESSKEEESTMSAEVATPGDTYKSPITDPVVLTPEIWEQIIHGLSGDDFLSVINTAPEWNHLLDSRKTTELFPMMLSHVLPYLEPNEMLACRLVQRSCKAAVDKFLETHALSDEVFSSYYEISLLPKLNKISCNYGDDIGELSQALALQTKAPSYNPFLRRTLSQVVIYPDSVDDEGRHINLTEFLSRYGTHLWLLDVVFFLRMDRICAGYLSSYLRRLPNLKTLKLAEPMDGNRWFGGIELPPLEHLSCLDLRAFKSHPLASQIIQKYRTQLTTLLVSGNWIKFSGIETSVFKCLLPKLKRLRVREVDPAGLKKLSVVDWPVEALHLELGPCMGDKRELLKTISNFKPSLRQLEVDLWRFFYGNRDAERFHGLMGEAMVIAESAFKQPTKMKKFVALALGSVLVKTRSDN